MAKSSLCTTLVTALVGALLSSCGTGAGTSSETVDESSPTGAGMASPAPAGRLKAETISASKAGGFYMTPLREGEEQPKVSRDEAVSLATAEFGFLEGKQPAEVDLARVTNWTQGRRVPVTGNPDRVYRLEPTVKGRLAWVVVFDGVNIPAFGGPLPTKDDPGPFVRPSVTSFVVWIDATTGKFLRGGSLPRQMASHAPYNYDAIGRRNSDGKLPTPDSHPCDTPEGERIC